MQSIKVLLYLAVLGEGNIGELYSSLIEVSDPITIGDSTKDKVVAEVLSNTDYNYWSTEAEEDNTYVFNRDKDNNDAYWKTNNTVTIDNGYTLKLITGYDDYNLVLNCYNIFTNNGNVIMDDYGILGLNNNYTSNNYGTIDIINGALGLWDSAILNNTGTITLVGSGSVYIYKSTVTNTGTIDISNITDLTKWDNYGKFTLEGWSTFILPKSITNKINTSKWFNPITLNGTK
ncbi:MAG: hypothetical protein IJ481_03085, partial [Alphaproteobacteria bacterium]|nr:hypothetical protein [Alphaproteobacteria bacterium]